MKKTYAIGDVHGNYKALQQVIERAPLIKGDRIIFLGDLIDGHSQSYEVIELIMSLYKDYEVILIKGNHDVVFKSWLDTGLNEWSWRQGQLATIQSYMENLGMDPNDFVSKMTGYIVKANPGDIPISHHNLFSKQITYFIDENNNLFIHGGFNRHSPLKGQYEYTLYWDRDLWAQALSFNSMNKTALNSEIKFRIKDNFKNIFIGHTSTVFWNTDKPMQAANIWNLDTGAGWFNKLTIMDVDSFEYWQSDLATDLYPNFKGRK